MFYIDLRYEPNWHPTTLAIMHNCRYDLEVFTITYLSLVEWLMCLTFKHEIKYSIPNTFVYFGSFFSINGSYIKMSAPLTYEENGIGILLRSNGSN